VSVESLSDDDDDVSWGKVLTRPPKLSGVLPVETSGSKYKEWTKK
jgi:hypothetical protein